MTAKGTALHLVTPLALATERLKIAGRLWAHARLASKIQGAVDESVVVLGVPEVQGTGRIFLGKDLYLYRELYLETQGTGEIHLGSRVVLSRGVHLVAFGRIDIGDDSMIGEYTSIRDANHRVSEGERLRASGHNFRPIRVGHNTWIGRGVTILSGVTIGNNCVVGANAVVTRDVPSGTTVAGVPARALEGVGR
jgi:acetyltransferase-like isoleucine patch superfamily enzyme